MRRLWVSMMRLLAVFRAGRLDRDLDQKLALHVELATEEYARRGLQADEARRAALRDIGGIAQTKERYRDVRSFTHLEAFGQDVRFALRSLFKRPLLLATATLSVGIGVGLNVSGYNAISRLLFDMNVTGVPPDPRLVEIGGEVSFPNFTDLRTTRGFTDVAAMQMASPLWQTDAGTERLTAKVVSPNFFEVVHVQPILGRAFRGDEAQSVLLSYHFWERRFARDPAVAGRTLTLNGWPFVVSGVMPPEFDAHAGLFVASDVLLPISPVISSALPDRLAPQFDLVGRLGDGVSRAQAVAALKDKGKDIVRQFPQLNARFAQSLSVTPLTGAERWRQLSGGRLGLVFTAAGAVYGVFVLVLLIACANVAGLLLTRTEERHRELAISAALGASRWRLAQRVLAEGQVNAVFGGLAGGVLFSAGTAAIAHIAWAFGGLDVRPPPLPLTYCGALVLVITVACSVGPALRASDMTLARVLAGSAYASRRMRGTTALVILQVAVGVVLLSGALFVLHSLMRLRGVDPGFDVTHTVNVKLRLPTLASSPAAARSPFWRIRDTLTRLPGVESVSCARFVPLSILTAHAVAHVEGSVDTPLALDIHPVGPRYLVTMQIPVLHGRDLADADMGLPHGSATSVVINDILARRFFGTDPPIGRRIVIEDESAERPPLLATVVGVARHSKLRSLNEGDHPVLYLPELTTTFLVRVAGPASSAVPSLVKAVGDREQGASVQVTPMTAQVALALLPARIVSSVLGALSAIGILLAMAGLYAVMNYTATSRTRELGIRMALGATAGSVIWLMLRQALCVIATGCAIGSVLALALTRLLSPLAAAGQGLLDPPVFGATVLTVVLIGLAASAWPARRAGRVDPALALRTE